MLHLLIYVDVIIFALIFKDIAGFDFMQSVKVLYLLWNFKFIVNKAIK